MNDTARIDACKQYLRRKYANNVPGLKQLAEKVAGCAFESVLITGNGYEGGNAQGVITFEPLAYLAAVEELIAELDPDNTPEPAPVATVIDFSSRAIVT